MPEKIILLVDDNENDLLLNQRALKKANIQSEVLSVSGGQEALNYLFCERNDPKCFLKQIPSVVCLDLKMPKVDGFEVLKQIRANPRTKYLPVVILTASREESDIERAYTEGCNAYVVKSVDFKQLAETLKQLGDFWIGLNEPPILIT